MSTYIIAEVGINHNGDMDIAKKLIDVAAKAGCDAVKFQKRTIDLVYSPEELSAYRISPWGRTNGQQKHGLEFSIAQLASLQEYARLLKLDFSASAWDLQSLAEVESLNPDFHKVASAMLTSKEMLDQIAGYDRRTYISTGMSELNEIYNAVQIFRDHQCEFILMHTCSQYPSENKNINLRRMTMLRDRLGHRVGYSGHERGLQISIAAVAMGATAIERHITLDRTMYGSDQAASLEPDGLYKLVRDIRIVEEAMGTDKVSILAVERPIRNKLANPYWKISQ